MERLLDPTTYILASPMQPKQPCSSTSQQTMYCYVTIARCSAPANYACLECYECYPVTPWFGLSHYYIVVDDMIIIILNILTKDGRSGYSRLGTLFHSSHLGPEFRVLVPRLSMPNLVWDAMGSPFLTYLASNISSGGPS